MSEKEHSINQEPTSQESTTALAQDEGTVAQKWEQKYTYLLADFENYKRRTSKEYESIRHEATVKLIKPLLEVMDNFERAFKASDNQPNEGFEMIYRMLEKMLKSANVTPIDVIGKQFDPEYHEALINVESNDHEAGTIVAELQKGYMLGDTIIRPAKVSVSQ